MARSIQANQISDAIVTAPGADLVLFEGAISVTNTKTNPNPSVYEDVDVNFTAQFTAPTTSRYRLYLKGQLDTTGGAETRFRVRFDQGGFGGFTEQDVGGGHGQEVSATGGGRQEFFMYLGNVLLQGGVHEARLQWIRESGTAALEIDTVSGWQLVAQVIGGSGLGGLPYEEDILVSSFDTSAPHTTYQDVGLVVNFNTFEGETVRAIVQGTGRRPAGSGTGTIQTRILLDDAIVLRDGVSVSDLNGLAALEDGAVNLSRVTELLNLPAGPHHLKFQIRSNNANLVRMDSGLIIAIEQPRGGFAEILDASGNLVASTPRYVQFPGATVRPSTANDPEGIGGIIAGLPQAVAAPTILLEEPAVNYPVGDTTTSNTFALIDDGTNDASFTFTITHSGRYRIRLYQTHYGAGGSGETDYRLNIDSGTAFIGAADDGVTTKATPDRWDWRVRDAGDAVRNRSFLEVDYEFTAGVHTIEVEWARHSGSTTPTVNQYDRSQISLELRTGSGANGTLLDSGTESGDLTNATAVPIVIPGLSRSFTVGENENVLFAGDAAIGMSVGAPGSVRLVYRLDGGSWIDLAFESFSGVDLVTTTSWKLPFFSLSAGDHTVDVGIRHDTGGTAKHYGTASGVFGSRDAIWQYRGGLMSWYQDSVLLTNKPSSVKVVGPELNAEQVGGSVILSQNASPQGAEKFVAFLSANQTITQPVGSSPASIPNTPLTLNFETVANETVWISYAMHGTVLTGPGTSYCQLELDGTRIGSILRGTYGVATEGMDQVDGFPYTVTAAGEHTLELLCAKGSNDWQINGDGTDTLTQIRVMRLRGGFQRAENIPQVIGITDAVASYGPAPGALPQLRLTLNDGIQRTALAADLSIDMDTTGIGGLETSATLTDNTWYRAFAVVNTTDPRKFQLVASPNTADVGPSDFSIYKYVGPLFWIDGTEDLALISQMGDEFEFNNKRETNRVVSLGSHSGIDGSWIDVTNTLSPVHRAFPEEAGKVHATSDYDSDGADHTAVIDGGLPDGSPPTWVPTASNEEHSIIMGQGSGRMVNARILQVPGGKLWRRIALNGGALDWHVSIVGWTDKFLSKTAATTDTQTRMVEEELDAVGTETEMALSYTPKKAVDTPSGRSLSMYASGVRMQHKATRTNAMQFTYNESTNKVEFDAAGTDVVYHAVYWS